MGNVLNTKLQLWPCSGCGCCELSCPNDCITMQIDSNGFIRPQINDSCTQCGLCTNSCVKFSNFSAKQQTFYINKQVFSFKNKDFHALKYSSSGGFIESIYKKCLENGFDLCGAIYDIKGNIVKHKIENTIDGIFALLGSKYLPSLTSEAFNFIKNNKNRKYIFVGTPCQVYGLNKWAILHRKRENFILIDFFCAGVPSYNLWKAYLRNIDKLYNLGNIESVSFRDKINSDWHHYGIRIKGSNGEYYQTNATQKDLFFKIFLSDSCKQLACSSKNCFFRNKYCFSDIRVGDFWGQKFKDDSTGVNVVIANTVMGEKLLSLFPFLANESELQIENLRSPHKQRTTVMRALKNEESIEKVIAIIERTTLITKIKYALKKIEQWGEKRY